MVASRAGTALLIALVLAAGPAAAQNNTAKTVAAPTCNATSALIVDPNQARVSALIVNAGTVTFYLSGQSPATTSKIPVLAGQSYSDTGDHYTGPYYCVTAAGSADVRAEQTFP